MLSTAAFNALLKTLEEPPPHAIFILATTEVHKIPATVLSRCQRHEFRRIPVNEIVELAERHGRTGEDSCGAGGADADRPPGDRQPARCNFAARPADVHRQEGHPGERPAGAGDGYQPGGDRRWSQAILDRQAAAGLNQIRKALDAGTDPRQFARQVVDYLRSLLLIRLGSGDQVDATPEQRSLMAQHAQAFDTPWLMETLRTFNSAASDQRSSWQPGLALELAFAQAIELPGQAAATSLPLPPVQSRPVAGPPPEENTRPPQASAPPARGTGQARTVREPATVARPAAAAPAEASKASTALPTTAIKPAESSDLSMQAIQQSWPRIRALVKKRKNMTEALLNSCKLMGVKDGVLILGFKTEVIKSKMEANDNLQIIRVAIKEVAGIDLQVTCVISSGKGSAKLADLNVENDGMVGTALRDLGGEIVDVK